MKTWKHMLLFPLFAIAAALLLGTAVMYLWNAIVPGLTGWSLISLPHAIGLLVLCRILFGGFRGRCGPGGHGWKHRAAWHERWADMTDEQRAELRARWKHRCGPPWARGSSSTGSGPQQP